MTRWIDTTHPFTSVPPSASVFTNSTFRTFRFIPGISDERRKGERAVLPIVSGITLRPPPAHGMHPAGFSALSNTHYGSTAPMLGGFERVFPL